VFLGYLVLERVLAHGMCTMLTVFHYSMSAWAAEYIAGKGKKGPSKSNA
jgi:acyl dehydratase